MFNNNKIKRKKKKEMRKKCSGPISAFKTSYLCDWLLNIFCFKQLIISQTDSDWLKLLFENFVLFWENALEKYLRINIIFGLSLVIEKKNHIKIKSMTEKTYIKCYIMIV